MTLEISDMMPIDRVLFRLDGSFVTLCLIELKMDKPKPYITDSEYSEHNEELSCSLDWIMKT